MESPAATERARRDPAPVPACEPGRAVISACYVVTYSSLSLSAVMAGLVVIHLELQTTFEVAGGIVAAVALIMAVEGSGAPARFADRDLLNRRTGPAERLSAKAFQRHTLRIRCC